MLTSRLQGKVALVTGVSSAVGTQVAERLVRDGGMLVVGASRTPPTSPLLLPTHVPLDVVNAAACREAVVSIRKRFGDISLLVHGAAVNKSQLLLKADADDIAHVLNVNVSAALLLTKEVLRHGGLLSSKPTSHAPGKLVVFLGSTVGVHGNAGQVAYAASKAALSGAAASLAKEYGNAGVRFNVISPGLIEGRGMGSTLPDAVKEQWRLRSALKRLVHVDDVADAVLMLAACHMINGQTIVLDGGSASM